MIKSSVNLCLSSCESATEPLDLLMMRYLLLMSFLFFGLQSSFSQIGRPQVFDFLNLSPSARTTALGGTLVATAATDSSSVPTAAAWLVNPAVNQSADAQQLSLSYQPYYADVDFTTLSYSQSAGEQGNWGLGMQYLSYGEIDSYDLTGQSIGIFSAQEYTLVFNRSHQSGPFRVGLNAKYTASNIAGFGAAALLFDLGGMFIHPNQDLSVGLSINHLGLLLNDYTSFTRSRLPSDLKLGLAFRPRYMPFRFYLAGYYFLNQRDAYFSTDNNEMPGYVNKVLRHLSLGGEFILSRNFYVLVGYNHLKGNTLQLEQINGGAGISFGLSLRLRFIQLDFSRAFYHVAGGVSHFTLTADLERLNFKQK